MIIFIIYLLLLLICLEIRYHTLISINPLETNVCFLPASSFIRNIKKRKKDGEFFILFYFFLLYIFWFYACVENCLPASILLQKNPAGYIVSHRRPSSQSTTTHPGWTTHTHNCQVAKQKVSIQCNQIQLITNNTITILSSISWYFSYFPFINYHYYYSIIVCLSFVNYLTFILFIFFIFLKKWKKFDINGKILSKHLLTVLCGWI